MRLLRLALCLLTIVASALSVVAEEKSPWIGKKVFVKETATPRTEDDAEALKASPYPSTITKVDGEWLWTGKAWVNESDVRSAAEAIDYYTTRAKTEPENPAVYIRRGGAYFSLQDYDRTIADMNKAIQFDSSLPMAYDYRAASYEALKKYDEAYHDFNKLVSLKPGVSGYHWHRANMAYIRRDYDRALADYEKTIELAPDNGAAHNSRGSILLLLGDREKALADFTKAKELSPKNIFILYNLGLAKHLDGKSSEAIAELSTAMKTVQDAHTLKSFQGPARIRGNVMASPSGEMRTDKLKALLCDGLAWIMATSPDDKVRDGKEAVRLATEAVDLTKEQDSYCLDTLAAAYAEAGDFEAAQKWEAKAIKLATKKTDISGCRERMKLYRNGEPYRQAAEEEVAEETK